MPDFLIYLKLPQKTKLEKKLVLVNGFIMWQDGDFIAVATGE